MPIQNTEDVKIYILADGCVYNSEDKNVFEQVDMPLGTALITYCGKRTMMMQWEEFKGIFSSITIPSIEDRDRAENSMTEKVFKKVWDRILKQLNSK